MTKEKEVNISEEVEKATKSVESAENVSSETSQNFDLNQKIDKIGADLKDIVDKLDSFEVSEEEQEAIMSGANEPKNESKSSLGWILLGALVLIIGAVAFGKDKILDKPKKQENTTI